MSCENFRPLISALIDRQLQGGAAAGMREEATVHLAACRACSAEFEAAERQRAALHSLSTPAVPAKLAANLRVMASHERARQLARITWRARFETLCDGIALHFENMMKPVALPIAGGLISALLMFGVLIPSVSYARFEGIEPPSPVFTEPDGQVVGEGEFPRLQSANLPSANGRVVVLLVIDDHGRVRDYHVTQGAMTPEVQNFILFSVFTPATMFGMPTWGQVQAIFGSENNDRRS
jgi:hypothetical protein